MIELKQELIDWLEINKLDYQIEEVEDYIICTIKDKKIYSTKRKRRSDIRYRI